jgi:RsiW-degrading membrane proteinase PrsW (M82 family)
MTGTWILLLLIITAALPAIIFFIWLRVTNSPFTLPWFLLSIAAGIISLLAAALAQKLFPPPNMEGLWPVFFGLFIRVALVEEASRLVGLIPILNVIKRRQNLDKSFCVTVGFVSGLGFAMMESAFYGISDFNIILIRAVTAAPLHGACGIRVCAAFLAIRKHPLKAIFLFTSAVLIHGAYNLIIASPALPSLLTIPIAFAALFASIHHLRKTAAKDDENAFIPPLT